MNPGDLGGPTQLPGQQTNEPMAATPTTRRSAATSPTLGTSPGAKRAVKRDIAEAPADVPDMSHMQLVLEVSKIFTQLQQDAHFYDNTTDALDNHAGLIDTMRARIKENRVVINKIAADVVQNDQDTKQIIDSNDEALKDIINKNDEDLAESLGALEAIVVSQGNQIAEMRSKVSGRETA